MLIANGLLPTRGSLMLDLIAITMVFVTVVLVYSIYQARVARNFKLHRTIQVTTAIVLSLALVLFELDVRFFTDWKVLAEPSPYFKSGWVNRCLYIHLFFAIPTPFLWLFVIWSAIRGFKEGFEQSKFNRIHRISGRIAAAYMLATAITGWVFYYTAFVA